jgi:hypothetical protein
LPLVARNAVPTQVEFLSEQEFAQIVYGVRLLPGSWFLDPAIDLGSERGPDVWVHPVRPRNLTTFSFCLTKGNNLIYMNIHSQTKFVKGLQVKTSHKRISDAFATIYRLLPPLVDSHPYFRPRATVIEECKIAVRLLFMKWASR